jgi:Cu/Ag efflux pump CusA
MPQRRLPPFVLAISLLAACKGPPGGFPSLLPRPAETPRDMTIAATPVPGLSAEETATLTAELDREAQALDAAEAAVATAGHDLAAALAKARGAAPGTDAWVRAQISLSRYDQARAALGAVIGRLAALAPALDGLAADQPVRARFDALTRRADNSALAADGVAREAGRALGG